MSIVTEFRVTSVWQNQNNLVIFSGIPLSNNQVASAKQIIVVTVRPELLPMTPVTGQHWQVTGPVKQKPIERNGYLFTELHIQPHKCAVTLPDTGESFIKFIAKEPDFKGIGEVKAREIWQRFGRGIYDILENQNAVELKGLLTDLAIQSLFAGYKKYANLKYAQWFVDHHIPPAVTQRLFKHHQEKSVEAIKNNPYRLLTFGMSFSAVDAIARSQFDIRVDDERRLVGAVASALQKQTIKGHTLAYHKELKPMVCELVGTNPLATKALSSSHSNGTFVVSALGVYHPTGMLVMEHVVAKRLLKLAAVSEWGPAHDNAHFEAVRDLPFPLTERQTEAVVSAMKNAVACITGGAGTGKTTVLRTVLRGYHHLNYIIKSIALSGRAAMRMQESTGFPSSTIAKFLREAPLTEDIRHLVVIDEASMVDLATMYKIVTHISADTRILFVGDPNQLPPISAGLVLADIVKSGVLHNTELNIVKRQDGSTGIPEYTKQVQEGIVPSSLSMGNIHHHEVPLDQVTNKAVELFMQSPKLTRIIGATYKAEHGGIDAINANCQSLCNANGQPFNFELYGQQHYLALRKGDPVIFTENDYEAGVQNGTLGKLICVKQTDEHFGIVELDTGQEVRLTQSLLDNIRCAYAISLHKAQGSQFPRVIIPLTKTKMLDRSWIYTALTRAENEIELIGPRQLLVAAIKRLGATDVRKTYLCQLLRQHHINRGNCS